MSRVIVILSTCVIAFGGVVMTAGAANAAAGDCSPKYWCAWEHTNYQGDQWGSSYNKYNTTTYAPPFSYGSNDRFSSVSANGTSCAYTRFFEHADGKGKSFKLYSQTMKKTNWKDPMLSNGAGILSDGGSSENWNDRISSVWFEGC